MKDQKMRRTSVIGYTRVSTPTQEKRGVSLEDQKQELEKFAASNELKIVRFFSDVGSGLNEEEGSKRDGYNVACKTAHKSECEILVTVPSRFTRTLEAYDRFVAKGGRLIAAKLGMDATAGEVRTALKIEIAEHEQRQ